MQCPTCKGKRELFAFLNKGEDHHKHNQGMVACIDCKGTGVVDDAYPQRLAVGTAFKRDRMAREESLFDCATRLGVRTPQLSAYENGWPIDDDALAKIVSTH